MNRLIAVVVLLLGLTSCFKQTEYKSQYILRPYDQEESGDDYFPLEGVVAYAFEGTTDEWEIASYEDALVGLATSIESGEQVGPFVWAEPYGDSATELAMSLDRIEVILVAIDPATQVYAYTDYEIPVNLSEIFVDIVFRPWKTASYTASTWTFIVPEVEEDEETEVDETEVDEDEDIEEESDEEESDEESDEIVEE